MCRLIADERGFSKGVGAFSISVDMRTWVERLMIWRAARVERWTVFELSRFAFLVYTLELTWK